jgi:hypothetical protein
MGAGVGRAGRDVVAERHFTLRRRNRAAGDAARRLRSRWVGKRNRRPVQPLPRESLSDALFGLFMSFTVLAIWLLALAVF